jgi:hypothetical protein
MHTPSQKETLDETTLAMALVEAASTGQFEIVEYLLNSGGHLSRRTVERALLAACKGELIPELIADIDQKKRDLKAIYDRQKEQVMKANKAVLASDQQAIKKHLYDLDPKVQLAKQVHDKRAQKLNDTMANYCKIIMLAIGKGARNQEEGMAAAAATGATQVRARVRVLVVVCVFVCVCACVRGKIHTHTHTHTRTHKHTHTHTHTHTRTHTHTHTYIHTHTHT